jgi:hypothetical protein
MASAVVIFAPAGFENVFRRMPEIFGKPGEPGPLWAEINTKYDTRLFPAGGGPQAVTDPALCGLSVRSDPAPGVVWDLDPEITAVWIVKGRYRFDGPDGTCLLGAGEYASFARPGVRGLAVVPGQALGVHNNVQSG